MSDEYAFIEYLIEKNGFIFDYANVSNLNPILSMLHY